MVPVERTFSLHVPSSTENLAMIREFVTSVGAQAGLLPDEVFKLELSVDEACANVIEHAYGSDVTKEVSIRATLHDDELEIVVIDTGIGFDPTKIEQKKLDKLVADRSSGGLGIRIYNQFMDEIHYHIIPGEKNELRMIKKLRKN